MSVWIARPFHDLPQVLAADSVYGFFEVDDTGVLLTVKFLTLSVELACCKYHILGSILFAESTPSFR